MLKETIKSFIVRILILEATIVLKKHKPTIIGITGSVGKTSTKDAIYAVLKNHLHVRKSEKNYNSDIGAALTILGLRNAWNNPLHWCKNLVDGLMHALLVKDYPKVLVLELGIDRPGDMKQLMSFIKPDIAVMTRLPGVPSHVEFFKTAEEVSEEKFELVRALKKDGVFIYNNDDEKIRSYLEEVRQPAFGYSRYSQSHFTASADKVLYDGSLPSGLEFTVTKLKESAQVTVRGSLGVQHTYNYSAAIAVADQFGVTLSDAAQALKEYTPPAGRMKIVRGKNKTLIIDDTYNSSPVACERALQALASVKAKRKIAVLGDMLELGKFSVREHERIGELAAESADVLLTIGLRSRETAEGALEHGLSEKSIFQYEKADAAADELPAMLQEGDVVLVKGSQSMRTERVVKAIMADPDKAKELLVRQEVAWSQKP